MKTLNLISSKTSLVDWSAIDSIQEKIFSEMVQKQNEVTEYYLRNLVVPPIKGEITKGKIKWRGLSLATFNNGANSKTFIMQRGKQIGCIYSIEGIDISLESLKSNLK